jgi:beta-glucosidase
LKTADSVRINDNVSLSFTVKNSGKIAGDEVVLVFVNDRISSITTPVKRLVAFRRTHLKPGEKEQLEFTINNRDFALLNRQMEYEVEPGEFDLLIGTDRMQKTIRMY